MSSLNGGRDHLRLVLDTDVLVASLRSERGASRQLLMGALASSSPSPRIPGSAPPRVAVLPAAQSPAAKQDCNARFELRLGEQIAVAGGQLQGVAERADGAGDDGDGATGLAPGRERAMRARQARDRLRVLFTRG